ANTICITNGFDENDAGKIIPPENEKSQTHQQKFTLSYIGVLEQLRNPENLWKALDELVTTRTDFAEKFILKFAGRVDDKILSSLENSGLKGHIRNLGYLSHDKAIEEMSKSNL